ncbi:hypothetical protein LCGC14_2586140 [marine sediment metagenome]|uniref:Transglycosylase SLT domain-containing protein n=1 Tax=marine sediment metagenome TaxID=412755 RepID=A0A0F9CP36_9ZZZZ
MKTFAINVLLSAAIIGTALLVYIVIIITKEPVIEVHEKVTIVREKQVYFERLEINQRIQEIQSYEDYDRVINLYGNIAGDREVARLILNNSLVRKIPVNLAFALCQVESTFKPSAMNRNIKNGKTISTDYGLFQLNSQVFRTHIKKNGKDWLLMPENNISLGLTHLQELYFRHGKSWDLAVIRYNGRFDRGADEHLVNVYEWERIFDKMFNSL